MTTDIPLAFRTGILELLNIAAWTSPTLVLFKLNSMLHAWFSWDLIELSRPSKTSKLFVKAAIPLKMTSWKKAHMRWNQSAWRKRML